MIDVRVMAQDPTGDIAQFAECVLAYIPSVGDFLWFHAGRVSRNMGPNFATGLRFKVAEVAQWAGHRNTVDPYLILVVSSANKAAEEALRGETETKA